MNGKRLGFTLIELLIVVAIIAILAAIAVPNFLEAQTRAKVARVKNDFRTLATAIEAYSVDWNRMAPGLDEINPASATALPAEWSDWTVRINWFWGTLTTPVAYITSVPLDPFALVSGFIRSDAKRGGNERYTLERCCDYYLHTTTPVWEQMRVAKRKGVLWYLSSWGPSRNGGVNLNRTASKMPGAGNYPDSLYDPSNGTM